MASEQVKIKVVDAATTSATIKKNSVITTAAVVLSRIFGLVREQVFAFFFGAGLVQDAYLTAFRIPNLFRDLFAEGALSQSFIAVFAQKTGKNDADAYRLANKVFTFILCVVGLITVLGVIFSPQIITALAPGFTGEKHDLTVTLNRILFPFILFASFAALFMGMLNAKHKFFLPQSASTFFNVTSITVGLIFAYLLAPDYVGALLHKLTHPSAAIVNGAGIERAIIGMSLGTLAGGLVQWLIQMPTLGRLGYRLRLDFGLRHPDLIKVLKLTVPAVIGGASVQINVLVNQNFASGLGHGAISYLGYAFRLMQLPLGLFGVAVATASAPALARMISEGKNADFKATLQSSLKMSLFLSLPSTVGLMVLAEPIVSLIFEHGKFDALDALGTIFALEGYALGIVAYSLIKIYQPAYLSWHDSKTPMVISLASIVSNFVLNFALLKALTSPQVRASVADFVGPGYSLFLELFDQPHFALALGTAFVATLNFLLLALSFGKKIPGIWEKNQIFATAKILLASLVMGAVAWAVMAALRLRFAGDGIFEKLILAGLPILIAAPSYFLICAVLRVEDAEVFIAALWRRLGRGRKSR